MSDTVRPDQSCSCSRNRKCAFHTGQLKQMQRVAKPVIEAQKVSMGIEDLRAKYARPETTRAEPVLRSRQRGKNGWNSPHRPS